MLEIHGARSGAPATGARAGPGHQDCRQPSYYSPHHCRDQWEQNPFLVSNHHTPTLPYPNPHDVENCDVHGCRSRGKRTVGRRLGICRTQRHPGHAQVDAVILGPSSLHPFTPPPPPPFPTDLSSRTKGALTFASPRPPWFWAGVLDGGGCGCGWVDEGAPAKVMALYLHSFVNTATDTSLMTTNAPSHRPPLRPVPPR